jgi:CARDB
VESAARRSASGRRRPPRRPERQQIVIRRALALGAGLLILVLIVLGVKGCLNARKERALSDYARNVTQIVQETQQTSKTFFARLSDPGELTVTDFVEQVNADRSAMDSYQSRVDGLDAPGDMGHAQTSLELVYDLRAGALNEIADRMSTALGEVGSEKATAQIAKQMEKLMASDVLYAAVVRPEVNRVLEDNGIEGDDVPESTFLPEGTTWLEEDEVSSALSGVSGSETDSETSGIHGMGLLGTSVNGTELVGDSTTAVAVEETPEVEVQVANQGESTESGVTVSVSVAGGGTFDQEVSSIEPGEEQTVVVPLVPAPSGSVELEVEVQGVPGEQITSNNEAAYTVEFE